MNINWNTKEIITLKELVNDEIYFRNRSFDNNSNNNNNNNNNNKLEFRGHKTNGEKDTEFQ